MELRNKDVRVDLNISSGMTVAHYTNIVRINGHLCARLRRKNTRNQSIRDCIAMYLTKK